MDGPLLPTPDPVEEAIFHAASDLNEPGARAAFLDRACGSDLALRARIEVLLAADVRASQFLGADPLDLAGDARPKAEGGSIEQSAGDQIGRYKLLEKIGEGGMGVVYMAEQREPVVRKVALKIIKAGMDTRQVIARFEGERQALALMDHPNIAKVLDGGETESGRPYFVMELVKGLPVTQFCAQAKLSTSKRLELFLEICSALQHAHQKGIIHRDLKPSNILVTLHGDRPVPKVIDFGIAKATQGRLTEKTLFTQFQQFVGTPAYMSPEQATLSALDVDTRSDVYGLGVLLYELLTGTPPFDENELLKLGLDEMRRTIREQEPPCPSTRLKRLPAVALTTTAHGQGMAPQKLITLLRGDLDWIVMKCLEKDRARRYETANALADDIRHYFASEPIMARPPSIAYRCRKTLARHKAAFSAAATIFAALTACSVILTSRFVKEREAHRRAVAAERRQVELRQEAEATRRKAEAGQTALLYWQAFDTIRESSREMQNELHAGTILDPLAVAARYDRAFDLLHRAAGIGAGCNWAVGLENGPQVWTPSFRVIRELTDAACLRAQIALSNGHPERARRDLVATFVLARHAAVDGTLVTVMAQTEAESRIAEFVAQHFGQFPPEVLTALIGEFRSAPPRTNVARSMREEQEGAAQWLIREIQRIRLASEGDEGKAMLSARDVLVDWIGPDADRAIAAAGGNSTGMVAYIAETRPYYDLLERASIAGPGDLKIEAKKIEAAVEGSTNVIVQRILPNVERARRREMEALAQLAMLEAALAYLQRGDAGLQSMPDPFGPGPFALLRREDGFELRSKLADHGYKGNGLFARGRP